MKKLTVVPAILTLLALGASNAQAEPKDGLGVDAGLTTHRITGPVTGNYQSSGLSLGLDYQIGVSDSFSINPFIMTSGENTSGALTPGTKATHDMFGLQFRYWIGDVFLGAHLAAHTEVLSYTVGNVTTSTSVSGGGLGLVAGWENPNGRMFVVGQLDSANLKYPTSTDKLSSFRLSIGYRWK